MNIIIAGAGQVGASLAYNLVDQHKYNITIIDNKIDRLNEISDKLDVKIILGKSSIPEILQEAGAEDADMIVAVTGNDEANMLVCYNAHQLFKVPKKVARIRDLRYMYHEDQSLQSKLYYIDKIFSPENLVANHIKGLIDYPNVIQVNDFANDKVKIFEFKIDDQSKIVGLCLIDLYKKNSDFNFKVLSIKRGNRVFIPYNQYQVSLGDILVLIVENKNLLRFNNFFWKNNKKTKNITIAGGGHIGFKVASQLQEDYRIKIIEGDKKRSLQLYNALPNALIINKQCTDPNLLELEDLSSTDIFIALTNNDISNIFSSIAFKSKNSNTTTISLINSKSYTDMVEKENLLIDRFFSPHEITLNGILSDIIEGEVIRFSSLDHGEIDIVENEVTKINFNLFGKKIKNIELPEAIIIAAIYRHNELMDVEANPNLILQEEDKIIWYCLDRTKLVYLEKLIK